jgi:predicted GIY-YIG superfamily endonuclease
MIGVYQIECLSNNKKYIGVSKDIQRRWREHRSLLFKGLHHSSDMQKDYNQYGETSFEFKVIKECEYAEAKSLEEQLIQKNQPEYNAYTNGKGNIHNAIGKRKEVENKIINDLRPHFTDEFKSGESFMMVNLFTLSKITKLLPTKILRYMGIDSCKEFAFQDMCDREYIIGMISTNDGLYVTLSVNNERAWEEGLDYYYVGE